MRVPGKRGALSPAIVLLALSMVIGSLVAMAKPAAAAQPDAECASINMTFVTKLQGIEDPGGDGPHTFTGTTVEGPAAGGPSPLCGSRTRSRVW